MHTQPVALVTGGSRGIGRGICIALAKAGYAVAVNYQGNEQAARETIELISPSPGLSCQGDVSLTDHRARMIGSVLSTWGRLDLLVNNAGISSVGRRDLLEATEDSWDKVMGTNLKGPFFLTQLAAQAMLKLLAEPQRPPDYAPAIINISSISAFALSTNRGDYCVSKAGMTMTTQLWAARLANAGIRVFEVRPGIVASDMTAGVKEQYDKHIAEGLTPIRRWGQPEDVGHAVASLAVGAIPYCTGEIIHIDGGYHLRTFFR